jgi:hypothetical protein
MSVRQFHRQRTEKLGPKLELERAGPVAGFHGLPFAVIKVLANRQSFFSLNSTSITLSSALVEGFWPANRETDDTMRSKTVRLNQGYVRRNAVAKPVHVAGKYSPCHR